MINRPAKKLAAYKKKFLSLLFAGILPLIFTFCWTYTNTQLPTADPASFLAHIISIYRHFVNDSYWNGLWEMYISRSWRPIIFPVLNLPLMFLFKGNIYYVYNASAMISMVASIIYIYLYLRLCLNRIAAITATNLIGLLPFIQAQAIGFYAESLFFPCVIGSIYHLIKSNYLRDIKNTGFFVVLISIAAMLRPVEMVVHFILVFGVFFALGWQQKKIQAHEFLKLFLFVVTSLSLLLFYAFLSVSEIKVEEFYDKSMLHFFSSMVKISGIVSALAWIIFLYPNLSQQFSEWRKARGQNIEISYFLPAFLAICLLVLLWFTPAAFKTFEWVFRTSLGDVAQGTTRIIGDTYSFSLEVRTQVVAAGLLAVVGAFTIMISGVALNFSKTKQSILTNLPFIYLIALAILPILEVLFTVQDIHRKLCVALPALLMGFLILGLQAGRGYTIRVAATALLAVLQFSILMYGAFSSELFNTFVNNTVGYYVHRPIITFPNPHDVLGDFLTLEAKKKNLKTIGLEVNPYTIEPVDPFLMSMLVQSYNQSYVANYLYYADFSADTIFDLVKRVDGVFLSDRSDRMLVSSAAARHYADKITTAKSPSLKLLYQLLFYYSSNQLPKVGWQVDSCITIKSACLIDPIESGVRTRDCYGCLIIPIKSS